MSYILPVVVFVLLAGLVFAFGFSFGRESGLREGVAEARALLKAITPVPKTCRKCGTDLRDHKQNMCPPLSQVGRKESMKATITKEGRAHTVRYLVEAGDVQAVVDPRMRGSGICRVSIGGLLINHPDYKAIPDPWSDHTTADYASDVAILVAELAEPESPKRAQWLSKEHERRTDRLINLRAEVMSAEGAAESVAALLRKKE